MAPRPHKYIFVLLFLGIMNVVFGQSPKLLKNVQADQAKLKKHQNIYLEIKSYNFSTQINLYQTILNNLVQEKSKIEFTNSEKRKLKGYFETALADFIFLDSIQVQLDSLFYEYQTRQTTLFNDFKLDQLTTLKAYRARKSQLDFVNIIKSFKTNRNRFYNTLEQIFIDNQSIDELFKDKGSFYVQFFSLINEGLANIQQGIIEEQEQSLNLTLEAQRDSLSVALAQLIKVHDLNIQIQKNLAADFEEDIRDLTDSMLQKDAALKLKEDLLHSKLADLSFVRHQLADLEKEKNRIILSKQALLTASRHLADNIEILADQETKISKNNKQLHAKNKTLAKEIEALAISKAQLEQTNEGISFWLKVLTGFALLGVVIIGLSAQRIYQSKQKIALAYENVEQANHLLESRTKELKAKTQALNLSHKELNHRVKNNLQQISSLIYLQEEEIEDRQAKEAFSSLQGRIDTIKIIHQKLYKQENLQFTKVKLSDYVEDLVRYIVGREATIQMTIPAIFIEMDHATDIGLIINELVTNADKYAFPNVENPAISIHIKAENELLFMEIRDNGIGFPDNFSLAEATSFGLKSIVELFVYKSERGQLEITNDNGAVIRITMPFNQEEGKLIA